MKSKGKLPAVVGIIFGIAGNVLYFCVRTKYGITLARFISGVGFSLDGSLIGTVRIGFKIFRFSLAVQSDARMIEIQESRASDPKIKSKLVGILLLTRQLGICSGPLLIFFVRTFNFRIGSILVDNFSGPGFFMACVWTGIRGLSAG